MSAEKFTCRARNSYPDPQDCDWPHCGCDPAADKVIEVLQEEGYRSPREYADLRQKAESMAAALTKIIEPFPCSTGPAEDAIEDWMSAVGRHRSWAKAALAAWNSEST